MTTPEPSAPEPSEREARIMDLVDDYTDHFVECCQNTGPTVADYIVLKAKKDAIRVALKPSPVAKCRWPGCECVLTLNCPAPSPSPVVEDTIENPAMLANGAMVVEPPRLIHELRECVMELEALQHHVHPGGHEGAQRFATRLNFARSVLAALNPKRPEEGKS